MGKRYATVIGLAAAGVMALGAQTAAAPKVVKYDTKVTITRESHPGDGADWHGGLKSKARKCVEGRRVVLLRQRPGPDRRLGSSDAMAGAFLWAWEVMAPTNGRVYAKAKETPACHADRSRIIENGDLCPEDPEQIACPAARSETLTRPGETARSAAAAPEVVKYRTEVTLAVDRCCFHGRVKSEVRKCEFGRRVTLFKQRPGTDRKLGTSVSESSGGIDPYAAWGVHATARNGDRIYAKVDRKVGKGGDVCRGDRSGTLTYPEPTDDERMG
jgi:hypothetical protein